MLDNSQVKNTPIIIYSLDQNIELNWKRVKLGISNTGYRILVEDQTSSTSFTLVSNKVKIANICDEYTICSTILNEKSQHQHGRVKFTGDKFSVILVFRVVNLKETYNLKET